MTMRILRVVCFGTSLTADRTWRLWRRCGGAWVAMLHAELATRLATAVHVCNAGRWGVDSRWGLANLDRRVLGVAADGVVLEFAVNDADMRRRLSIAQSRDNLEQMIARIRQARRDTRIAVAITNPVFGRHAVRRPRLSEYYAAWREVTGTTGATLVDLEPGWRAAIGQGASPKELLPDGIHPSAAACRTLVVPGMTAALIGPLTSWLTTSPGAGGLAGGQVKAPAGTRSRSGAMSAR